MTPKKVAKDDPESLKHLAALLYVVRSLHDQMRETWPRRLGLRLLRPIVSARNLERLRARIGTRLAETSEPSERPSE
jgi:hypothetical protein